MAILTIILLVSTVFALGDATKQPRNPCELSRETVKNGPPGDYVPTCDCKGEYTPEQHWGFTGSSSCLTRTGQKIPGTETHPVTAPIKCACSGARR
ncbi:saxiphilin-like isoform X2 [Salmo trutta]|uniref:Saxiphilin-like n=1 Tax=Salmo trutta TaxID=8032 RepID=A0A674AL39_SALTR|nr:saxiphilin-like isoform X2 [Salmo trutta]